MGSPGGRPKVERIERRAEHAALVVSALVVLLLLWRASQWEWTALHDYGVLRLRSLDVGRADTPLVGPYSRVGWNHPGPLIYYAYAPVLRLFGGQAQGMLVAALAINVAAAASAIALARRAGPVATAVVSLTLAALITGLDTVTVIDPWNPFVALLPLFAAMIGAWQALLGSRMGAVVLVVGASFAAQCHTGYALVSASLVVLGLGALAVRSFRGPAPSRDRRTLMVASILLVTCWLAPLVDQLRGRPGNLELLVRYFLEDAQPTVGFAAALRIMSDALSRPAGDMGFYSLNVGVGWAVPWGAILLLAAVPIAYRRRWRWALALCAVALTGVAATVVSMAGVSGFPYPHLFRWAWVTSSITWAAGLLVVVCELRERWAWARWSNVAMWLLTVGLLVTMVWSGPAVERITPWEPSVVASRSVIDPVIDALSDAPGPTLLTVVGDTDLALRGELLVRADAAGIDLRQPPALGFVYGHSRDLGPEGAASQLVFVSGAEAEPYAADPAFGLVTSFVRIDSAERAELAEFDARLDGQDPASLSATDRERYEQLRAIAEPVLVYLSPAPDR